MENLIDSNSTPCFYCQEYQSLYSDVPLNDVIYDINGITPRCFLHYKYECTNCKINIHFNGISWCQECKIMTCINCGKEKIKKKNFLIYDYFFEIKCIKCGSGNPALDYAEFNGVHPYQIGDLWPTQPINIWLPMNDDDSVESISRILSGSQRILNLSTWKFEDNEKSTKDIDSMNSLTQDWSEFLGQDHRILFDNLYLPEIIKIIGIEPQEHILEIGCGKGELSRLIAEKGATVTGIDTSNIISEAIKINNNEALNISYLKTRIKDFREKLEPQKYNKIVCNLKIMTIENLSKFFEDVLHHLLLNGDFIFSISHPFSGLPNASPIRIPVDSQRNEDQFWMINDYFKEGRIQISRNENQIDLTFFRRTLSKYLNSLISAGFSLVEISEPQANSDLVSKFPNLMYKDKDRVPGIMIIKARRA